MDLFMHLARTTCSLKCSNRTLGHLGHHLILRVVRQGCRTKWGTYNYLRFPHTIEGTNLLLPHFVHARFHTLDPSKQTT